MSASDPPAEAASGQDDLHAQFDRFWRPPPGLGRLSAVNHTVVGRRFVVTGFIFFIIGGVLALLMRTQLARPDNAFLAHDTYNQLFTMHGTTMMFLFAVPIMEGFAMYLIPKMIGARDLVFPRLSAFGYWCYLFGGLLLYSGLLIGQAPDGGWFMYVPLTSSEYTPGMNSDFWLLGVTFVEISALTAAAELIVSILKSRAPGMAIHRMPLFGWYILVTAFMIVFGFPPLILGSVLLEIERAFALPYFDPDLGGDSLLWQHLFWLFGHPEVYIIFLPAAGVVAMVVPAFARRPVAGYLWVVLAAVSAGFISFGLWVHHMFATGIPQLALAFFSAASMAVVIPSAIQIFAFIATLWSGRPVLRVPLLFILGFLFVFVLGGLTGVMLAVVPFNWQAHDTHFVVAHLHYVLIGGMVLPLFAGLYYWIPLNSGRMLSESVGKWVFWLLFVGFNVIFLPMHLTGLVGMPRRVYQYESGLGWDTLNLVSTIGAYVFAAGVLVFLVDVVRAGRRGERVTSDPWNANTLEWAIPMPAPSYNFISIPRITGGDPMWQQDGLAADIERGAFYLGDPSPGRRETMGTDVVSGEPEQVIRLPDPSWTPLITAGFTGVFFIGFLVGAYGVAAGGALLALIAALVWAWRSQDQQAPDVVDAGGGLELPIHYASAQAPGWWGLLIMVLADAALYGSLIFAYFFLWTSAHEWPPAGYRTIALALPTAGVALLVASSGAIAWMRRRALADTAGPMRLACLLALLLAGAYCATQIGAYAAFGYDVQTHAYAAVVYTIIGFHLLHALVAIIMAAYTLARSFAGHLSAQRTVEARNTAFFWHYMVIQWLIGYAAIHLFPLAS